MATARILGTAVAAAVTVVVIADLPRLERAPAHPQHGVDR